MEAVEHVGEQARLAVVLALEEAFDERAVRGDPVHAHLVEHLAHEAGGLIARVGVHDDLREHRVEEARHLDALADPRLHAHVVGPDDLVDLARRGQKPVAAVLGVEAHLDRVAARRMQLVPRHGLARGLAHHPLHEVDAAAFLGDAVFHLQARVHLEEVEFARALVVEELDRAGASVANALREALGCGEHAGAHLVGEVGGGAFLDDLLVAALHRAVALGDGRGAGGVAEDLHLDVAGALHVFLQEHVPVAEVRLGQMARALEGAGELLLVVADLDADAAAARGRLEHHGVADFRGGRRRLLDRGDEPRARRERHARLARDAARHVLQPELLHLLGLGPDEHDSLGSAAAGELHVLA